MDLLAAKVSALKKFRTWLFAENAFYAKLLSSSLVGVLAIGLLATFFLVIGIRDHRYDNLRTRTLEIVRVANKVENDLASLETCHRGFLLTGQQSYRQPFGRRKELVDERLNELQNLVVQDATQRDRVLQVRHGIDQWLHTVVQPELDKRAQNASADSGDTLSNTLVEEARKTLRLLQEEEQAQLNTKTKEQTWASLSFQVLVFAPKLESVISELEKSEWGYLLTGDKSYLDVYKRAAGEFYAFHGHLSVLLARNPEQLAAIRKIKEAVELWQAEAATPEITAKQAGKNVAAIVAHGRGKEIMDGIHLALHDFERGELDVYKKANFRAEIQRLLTTAGFAVLCILAIGFLLASSRYSFVAYRGHLQKIERAEAQTRSIIETTLDGVLTIDDQGLVQSINPAAEKMFGYPSLDVVGENVSKLIPQRLFLHDMAKLGRGTLMATAHRQGYYPFPIEISLNDMQVNNKRHYVALIRDVTERKRSEDTLRDIGLGVTSATGEEFIRSLVKQLSKALQSDFAFIVEMKRDGNEMVSSLAIAEHGQIRSKLNYDLENTACGEVLKKGFRAYPNGAREKFPADEILRELCVESFVAMPLVDHKGRPVGLMGVLDRKPMESIQIVESTLQIFAARAGAEIERKRFEEDLAAEKERLAVTLRSIGDGCITITTDGKIIMLNNVAEKLTGWTQYEATGRPLAEVFNILNEKTRKPCRNALLQIVESGSVVGMASNTIIVAREGTERLVEMSASPIRDKTNRKIGVVLVFRDVTEKYKADEERRKAEKLESLGVAAGGIAHDFNNLLTAIIGNLSLTLISMKPEDELAERLTAAKKASLRAQELAQQLLTFAKGGAPIKKTASVGQLIHDTVSFSLRGTNIRHDFVLPPDLWPVEIDPGQISQVIGNLTINAEQAMPAGGTVQVNCENFVLSQESSTLNSLRLGKYVKITIQDEGIGIPEEYLKKIFDPYFTTKPKGSGLGLATSYSIIRNHEGMITVDSKAGAGSTFCIYLPASDKEVPFEKSRGKQPVIGSAKILVLDDEEAICALVSHALTPLGCNVTESNDALTAIRLYDEALKAGCRFDAVIMDLTIPGGMGGQEAIKRIREIDPTVKAIVSSGYATDPVMSRHRDYGFCGMIAKPYEVSDLGVVVAEVLQTPNETLIYHDFIKSQTA